ncbi:Topoisomerase 1-associated factor 1 [Gryganskiella cystojenkinii]|nr:Topoisomerase 1-associated factor 1 [Gryganskiella cystojenkinii]
MDPDIESLLVSTCSALGGFEDRSENADDSSQVYVMGDECLECLKDIKKFIKLHGSPGVGDNPVLAFLGNMGILQKDLIPIMLLNSPADNSTKERLVLACIELFVPMTWIIDFKALQEMAINEEDNSLVGNLYEQTEILRSYKRAFLQPRVLESVINVLMKPLNTEYRIRTTRDQAIIRLGLSLFRNLVAIQDAESSITASMDQFIQSIMQDTLLERFEVESVTTLLVVLASSSNEPHLVEWNAITLEIFYHIFSGIDPEELIPSLSASTPSTQGRLSTQGRVENTRLQDLLAKEAREKKAQPTAGRKRHDRFGTTGSVRLQDGTTLVLHKKGALFTDFEQQLDDIKKPRAKTKHQKDSTEYKKNLTKSGAERLQRLATTLLESCYNPLFGSLRKDIESGRERIKDHHKGQYHFLMSFLLKYQRLYVDYLNRQHVEKKKITPTYRLETLEQSYQKSLHDCGFHLVATSIEVRCIFQIVQSIRAAQENKKWDEVRTGVNCLQEMLSTLYAMGKSSNQEYVDASNHVQNNLYYEESTLELFVELAKTYKKQSKKYLHTLLKMIHVLLKSLESYSKQKPNMIVSKKVVVRPRKKKADAGASKDAEQSQEPGVDGAEPSQIDGTQEEGGTQQTGTDENETQEVAGEVEEEEREEGGDESEPKHTLRERQFMFEQFERKFANEQVIETYRVFLEDFATLNDSQLHLAASMFHRIAVNCKNMAAFYKMSTLHLFHQILLKGHDGTKRDLEPFVSYVLHQFFKKMQEYPLLIVETFFPSTRQACMDINVGRDTLELEDLAVEQKKEKRLMAVELQVDPRRSEEEQIQIAVMALLDEDKDDLIDWVVEILKSAVVERYKMTFRTEDELNENPDLMHSVEGVQDIPVETNEPKKQKSLRVEARLRLLLKLLSFTKNETLGGDLEYSIPKTIPTDTLQEHQALIEAAVEKFAQGEQDQEMDYDSLITRMKQKPAGGGSTRKRNNGVNRQDREQEEVPMYHSAEYVIDSEDEEDVYFDREKQLRERISQRFSREQEEKMQQLLAQEAEKKRLLASKKSSVTARAILSSLSKSDDDDQSDADPEDGARRGSRVRSEDESENDEDKENRRPDAKSKSDIDSSDEDDIDGGNAGNSTSFISSGPASLTQRLAASTITSPAKKRRIILDSDEDDEDDEDEKVPAQAQAQAQSRSSFKAAKSRPPARKFARQEEDSSQEDYNSDGFSDGGRADDSLQAERQRVQRSMQAALQQQLEHEEYSSDGFSEGGGIYNIPRAERHRLRKMGINFMDVNRIDYSEEDVRSDEGLTTDEDDDDD